MKNLVTAIILSTMLSVAGTAKESLKAESANIKQDIKKIRVTGQLIVYLVQSQREEVTIDEGDPTEISVQQVGNTLSITADGKTHGVVTVYFKVIFRVDASNSSSVFSIRKLHLENLQVFLTDTATAMIKADTQSLYTVIEDHSKLEMKGMTKEHILQTYGDAELKLKHFTALSSRPARDNGMLAGKEGNINIVQIGLR